MRGMRLPPRAEPAVPPRPGERRGDWHTLAALLPYLWAYKGRVLFAIGCLIAAKVAVVGVPVLLKHIVDWFAQAPAGAAVAVPLGLIVAYGALRLATSVFTELREFFFAKIGRAHV